MENINQLIKDVFQFIKDISQPLIALIGVWMGWRLGVSSQRKQRRLDHLNERFAALCEVMKIVDNIPHNLKRKDLINMINRDSDLHSKLTSRLIRLIGIRSELISSLEPEFINFIDNKFRPLFLNAVGSWELSPDKTSDFAEVVCDLQKLVEQIELKLLTEQNKLIK
jgi:hypothetical protein